MLGDVYRHQGKIDLACEQYRLAATKMEDINHPEVTVPLINLAMVAFETNQFHDALNIVSDCIPRLQSQRKITAALIAQIIKLCSLTMLSELAIWEKLYQEINKLLDETGYVDSDIPSICTKTSLEAFKMGFFDEGTKLLKIAKRQTQKSDNPMVKKQVEELQQKYEATVPDASEKSNQNAP